MGQVHDDVIKWKHFPHYRSFVRGIHRSLVYPKSPLYFPIVISPFYYSTSNYYTANEFINSILHYCDVLMTAMASQITCVSIVYCSGADKKTSKFRVTGLCVGNSPVTGEFPAQKARNAENASIWWRHHTIITTKQSTTKRCFYFGGYAVCHAGYGKWRLLPHRWCLSEVDQWHFLLTWIHFNPSMDK